MHLWRPVARATEDVADTVGSAHLYPFDPGEAVVEKLAFVHARVTARRQHFNRDDAIAAPSAPDPPTT